MYSFSAYSIFKKICIKSCYVTQFLFVFVMFLYKTVTKVPNSSVLILLGKLLNKKQENRFGEKKIEIEVKTNKNPDKRQNKCDYLFHLIFFNKIICCYLRLFFLFPIVKLSTWAFFKYAR